jgi:hypothetical protein
MLGLDGTIKFTPFRGDCNTLIFNIQQEVNEMGEHLTVEELLISMKYCKGELGGDSCEGCPNAVPGSKDKEGFCQCRFDLKDEIIRVLESVIHKAGGEHNA